VRNQRQSLRILLILLLACYPAWAGAALAADEKPEPQVDLFWSVKIPMRDGVKLDATVATSSEALRSARAGLPRAAVYD